MNITGLYKKQNDTHWIMNNKSIVDITDLIQKSKINILHGDTISIENDDIKIIKPNTDIIVGILHISSKISYGITGKGCIIKKFTPYDKNYPSFLVSTKKTFQANDIYVVIKFERWNNNNNICCGSIVEYIGDVGDIISEKTYIHKCATSTFSNIKKINTELCTKDTIINRIDLRHEIVYSVDPPNCKDIDDALHAKQLDDGYEIGIHIADVTAYIQPNTPLDNEIKNRCESVYLDDKQINMLPDSLSFDKLSLLQSADKSTFSIIVKLDKDCNIISYEFCRALITVKENMSYDKAQVMVDKNNSKYQPLLLLYNIANTLYNKKKSETQLYDTHKMIEIYMVMANSLAAIQLYKLYQSNALIRKHKIDKNISTHKSFDSKLPSRIINKINLFNYDKAEYGLAEGDFKHTGLDEDYYTHFTSPIRRYADIIVHRMLSMYSIDNIPNKDIIFNINYVHNNIKNCQTRSNLLTKIIKMDTEVHSTFGHIIGIEKSSVRVHISELDIDTNVLLFSDKLEHLLEIKEIDDNILLMSKTNDNMVVFRIGQKIELTLAVTLKDVKKLKIKITDPDIQSLFGDIGFEEL